MSKAEEDGTRPKPRRRRGRSVRGPGKTVRLRPANPFDLICLIARSQSDPRKAVAELVQNSLDAGARHVTITRRRRKKEVVLSVHDDGQGVFPGTERAEALERIATNIGYSFKRNLSPAERREEMMLGKYGIGILGFWAVGNELEMRTRVSGSDAWVLRLVRDRPTAEVSPARERSISFPGETWTEVVVRSVDPAAARQLAGRKLGDYLGSELRGQLLERRVKLRIVDRVATGLAPKDFVVIPQRFRGRAIREIATVDVPGHSAARLELYYLEAEEGACPAVSLTCGGSTVCDDLAKLEAYCMDRPPWSLGCLEGVVEFPDLEVVPTTRRGFVPGPASDALFEALRSVEPAILQLVELERERRRLEEDEDVAKELRKVFRPVAKALPQYDFFDIRAESRSEAARGEEDGARLGRADAIPADDARPEAQTPGSEVIEAGEEPEPAAEILPPGPLEMVRVVPRRFRILPGATRRLVARAADAGGRSISEGVALAWSIAQGGGSLVPEGLEAAFTAPLELGTVRIAVRAEQGGRTAEAEAAAEVVEKLSGERRDAGIPDPKRVFDPAGDWRSRIVGRRWEYNAAHPDYQKVVEEPRQRLRYLVHLFAKEIVLRNYGEPKDERLLERMVEVLTHVQARG